MWYPLHNIKWNTKYKYFKALKQGVCFENHSVLKVYDYGKVCLSVTVASHHSDLAWVTFEVQVPSWLLYLLHTQWYLVNIKCISLAQSQLKSNKSKH